MLCDVSWCDYLFLEVVLVVRVLMAFHMPVSATAPPHDNAPKTGAQWPLPPRLMAK